jgi:hypothetical protein
VPTFPSPNEVNVNTDRLRSFTVRIAIVPSMLEVQLLGAQVTYETRTIQGRNLKDAKARAGIS